MLIVDAQVHTWAGSTPERPWPAGGEGTRTVRSRSARTICCARWTAAGVDRAVLVPPSWEGGRNDLALEAAQAHPERFAVMGRIPNTSCGLARRSRTGASSRACSGCGSRSIPHSAILITESHGLAVGEAEAAGVPLMVLVWHSVVHLIDAVAERYPRLKLVMDHLSLDSSKRDEVAFRELDKLLALAKRPNVAVKVSALPCYSTDTYPYRSLHRYLRRAYDAFGPRRMFWGTDLTRSPIPYRQHVTMFTEEIPWLTEEDKTWIMGRGVCEWLGWAYRRRSP